MYGAYLLAGLAPVTGTDSSDYPACPDDTDAAIEEVAAASFPPTPPTGLPCSSDPPCHSAQPA